MCGGAGGGRVGGGGGGWGASCGDEVNLMHLLCPRSLALLLLLLLLFCSPEILDHPLIYHLVITLWFLRTESGLHII